MKLNQKGLLIVLSGPSGVGKGTVREALFRQKGHDLLYSVSMTTRPPREGEVHGREYFFISPEEFRERIKNNKFMEYAEFVGNMYGTPADIVEKHLQEGKEVVLEIDVQGALQVKAKMPDAVFIFIAPPSFQALKNRLLQRGTEDDENIQKRLAKARRELDFAPAYDYIVVNDEVNNAADRIMAIIRAEHAKCSRSLEGYFKLLEEEDEQE